MQTVMMAVDRWVCSALSLCSYLSDVWYNGGGQVGVQCLEPLCSSLSDAWYDGGGRWVGPLQSGACCHGGNELGVQSPLCSSPSETCFYCGGQVGVHSFSPAAFYTPRVTEQFLKLLCGGKMQCTTLGPFPPPAQPSITPSRRSRPPPRSFPRFSTIC